MTTYTYGSINGLLSLTPQPGTQFQVNDTAANIEALTVQQIATLEALPVVRITAIDASVSLSVAQVAALEAGDVTVTVPSGDTVTLVDTVANLESLSNSQVSSLAATGVTGVTVSDTATDLLSLTGTATAALAAVNAAIGGSGRPAYQVVDTAENILSNLNALDSDSAISVIDVTDTFNSTSPLSIGAGATFELSGGSTDFGGLVSGAGALQMESGAFELASNLQVSAGTWGIAALNNSDSASVSLVTNLAYGGTFTDGFNGTINLDGHTLTLSGDNSLLGGWVDGASGSLIVTGSAVANSFIAADDVVLEDRGSITQNSYIVLGLNTGDTTELKIDNGAQYLLQGSQIFDGSNYGSGGGTTLVDNRGALEVSNLAGQGSTIYSAIQSSGSITVESGASLDLANSTLTNDGLVTVASGATLNVADSVNANSGDAGMFSIGSDATIEFGGAVADNQTVTFSAGTGVLELDDLTQFNAAIKGMEGGDSINISDAGLGSFSTITDASPGLYNAATGTTSVMLADDGATVATLVLDGNYSNSSFDVTANGGTLDITDPILTADASCYCRGTLIRTEQGEVAIEDLAIGDAVMASSGVARLIKWIGRRQVVARSCDPLRAWPVRIKAHALADGVPSRDLLVSPDHALLVDDVLIQAGALVNGRSITRETHVPEVFTYFHIELEDHALIFAENAPAETFVDNVDRLGFDNWAEHEALYPNGNAINEMPYPRVKAYRQVPRLIRERLAQRGALFANSSSVSLIQQRAA